MNFLIADTFTDSLARLTADEQKAAKTTAFDLQVNPATPGLSFHKLDRARDKHFWSVRVSGDIRVIVHRTSGSLLLCYVDHHDAAYQWAERRKLETHPHTGAAQLVEIRETVQEIVVPKVVEVPFSQTSASPPLLFGRVSDEDLLNCGVPPEWLNDVRVATEDSLFTLTEHLPAEAAEALLELATGNKPRVSPRGGTTPFEHPDARRRFRLMTSQEELARALEFPWEKWTVFLHPEQQDWVEKTFTGPARVAGSAGTGKTIVALHRAAHLARSNPDARVLLTTFSDALANALLTRRNQLMTSEPRLAERVDVYSLRGIAQRLSRLNLGPVALAGRDVVWDLLQSAAAATPGAAKFSQQFLLTEWDQVVDAWQLAGWDAYRDVPRLGRKTRLPEAQRRVLWDVFHRVREGLKDRSKITEAQLFTDLAAALRAGTMKSPFDYAVVDEAQDLGVPQLRFLAALAADRPNGLFFAGDLGQRIFQQPFSWKSLGVEVRGRSRTLRVNYRTSHQIRYQADLLLGPSVSDVDGNSDDRTDTVSVFNGPAPQIQKLESEEAEARGVAAWIKERPPRRPG